jgi:aryl-alcohol dehydrogenase-like predicted oxidoreductase
MKYTTLPNTEIEVSKICLGMTFGQQNTEAEGHEQMDYALEKELILDTAEMYSVPT